MAAIDDLTAAVGELETTATAVEAEVKALQGSSDEAALAALTGRVQAVTTALAALIPPPPPPAAAEPAPEPAPAEPAP